MTTALQARTLLERLVYLDRAYVADLYEVLTGESPSTQITRSQNKKAGAQIPVFSAEVSAGETRSFPVSTFAMLSKVLPVLEGEQSLDPQSFKPEMPSAYGWIEGELTVFKVQSSRREHSGEYTQLAADAFFQLRAQRAVDLALITAPDYFAYGLNTFLRMQDTLLKELSLPVRAFMRTLAAQSHTGQWVAVPLVVLEKSNSGLHRADMPGKTGHADNVEH